MRNHNIDQWQHDHYFHIDNNRGENNTRRVMILTLVMMILEIIAGMAFGSMALLADGWHMGTHAAALGIATFAYVFARRHKDNPAYTFGTGKVGVLGGFASAVVLAVVALLMVLESSHRFLSPIEIHFNEAIAVAILGLVINLISALMLRGSHDDHHHHHDKHSNVSHQHDHNLRAAYLHVLADALTSILAIFALLTGKMLGWIWMDPVMGIVGAALIIRWSIGLLRDTSRILLDGTDQQQVEAIRQKIESEADNSVTDLHLWQVGADRYAAIISIFTHYPKDPEHYKGMLKEFHELEHVSIEINPCRDEECNSS